MLAQSWVGPWMCVLAFGRGAGVLLILTGGTGGQGLLYPGGGTMPSRSGDLRAEIPVVQVIIFHQIRAEEGSESGQMCLQASLVLGICN